MQITGFDYFAALQPLLVTSHLSRVVAPSYAAIDLPHPKQQEDVSTSRRIIDETLGTMDCTTVTGGAQRSVVEWQSPRLFHVDRPMGNELKASI